MRSGGYAVQQALAADAAAMMRQAVSVARHRGHAQVTPLHVASAMLADDAGILRAACLRSRPASAHPLQCKALELCFNVALNRLTTAGAPPAMYWSSQQKAAGQQRAPPPALSNALAAAFKRAQANQRRGGGGSASAEEGQQQQAAASKVELEQLVISILDDPSVNRVMREAGFSSAEVKANVEKAAVSSSEHSSNTATTTSGGGASPPNPSNTKDPIVKATKPDVAGDAARVLDSMTSGRGKRCVAVVGENAEAVVKAVMDKVSKGDELHQLWHGERLKNLQFVPLSVASFRRMKRGEVEASTGHLRALVCRGSAAGKGVVVVLEDLGFAAEAWIARSSRARGERDHYCYYCPVEHAVMELSRLVRSGGDHARFWLLAFGTHASYATCRAGQPSLEAVLEMHSVVVPRGGLALSLGGDSEITYCGTDMVTATPASVPSWFRRCQGPVPVLSGFELTLSFSSPAASSTYGFPHCDANLSSNPWQLWLTLNHRHDGPVAAESHGQQWPASPNPGSSTSVSISSGGVTKAAGRRRRPKFTELTAENLKILCGALETSVPRHRDLAPGIASAVLRRRSGVTTRNARPSSAATWLLFGGGYSDGKAAVARELARLVFGSYDDFTTIEFTKPVHSGSSPGGDELISLKRRRSPEKEELGRYVQRLHEAVRENPHRVFLIDGVELSDDGSEEEAGIIKSAIATGTVRSCNGDVASLEDAIVVLSCEVLESCSRAPSRRRLKPCDMSDDIGSKEDDDGAVEKGVMRPRFSLDLNACAIDGELEEGSSSHGGVEILGAVDGVFLFQ